MKRALKITATSVGIFFVLVMGTALFLVRFPQSYFKQEWVIGFLKKQDFARDWTWSDLSIGLTSPSFLEYLVSIEADDLNAGYDNTTELYVLEDADISLRMRVSYSLTSGLKVLPLSPIRLHAKDVQIVLQPSESPPEAPPQGGLFAWKELLSEIRELSLPNIDLNIANFRILSQTEKKERRNLLSLREISAEHTPELLTLRSELDMHIENSPHLDARIEWSRDTFSATLSAPTFSLLQKPHCSLRLENLSELEAPSPLKLNCTSALQGPLLFSKLRMPSLPLSLDLKATVSPDLSEPSFRDVSFDVRSPNPTWKFEATFARPEISLEKIRTEPARAIEELLPSARAEVSIPRLKRFLRTFPPGYNEAPAPISAMDGPVELKIFSSLEGKTLVSRAEFATHLKGAKQEIKLRSQGLIPWDTSHPRAPKMGALEISVLIDKFLLMLPRVSVREKLPALLGDSRIQRGPEKSKTAQARKTPEWTLSLKTREAVSFRTSLLKEEFKFLFDLVVGPDGPETGTLSLLPMKAEILRRPIEVQSFVASWNGDEEPTLNGRLRFALPEYEIFLKIEGTFDSPRTAFESKPPLATDDIYAVLLFGRPLSELDPEGRQGIGRVQQGLAQGFFSLSTLYLLAGSRIESLGFDPNTNDVTAQLRLDKRHTLRVGTQDGQGAVALRRSLGGGWFIESSAQDAAQTGSQSTNFGLLLQRVIAY